MEQFSYVKRGYSPEEVNKYIQTLEQVIKSYKEKDNAIKNAIISAQVAADNVVRNAHMQAHEYKKKISQQLLQVSAAIDAERMRLQAFHDVYMGLMKKYIFEVETSDMTEISKRLDDMDILVNDLLAMEVPPIGESTPLLPEPESSLTPLTAQPYTPEPEAEDIIAAAAPAVHEQGEILSGQEEPSVYTQEAPLQAEPQLEPPQEQPQENDPPIAPPPRYS